MNQQRPRAPRWSREIIQRICRLNPFVHHRIAGVLRPYLMWFLHETLLSLTDLDGKTGSSSLALSAIRSWPPLQLGCGRGTACVAFRQLPHGPLPRNELVDGKTGTPTMTLSAQVKWPALPIGVQEGQARSGLVGTDRLAPSRELMLLPSRHQEDREAIAFPYSAGISHAHDLRSCIQP